MKIIFYVDGKVFYSKSDFKKHLIKNKKTSNIYDCKKGIYWCKAYLVKEKYDYKVVISRGDWIE